MQLITIPRKLGVGTRGGTRSAPAFAVALALMMATVVSAHELATPPDAAPAPEVAQQAGTPPIGPVGFTATMLLQTSTTVRGQPIRFPQGDNQFTALLGEIAPGGQAGRHMHPVPLLVYILELERDPVIMKVANSWLILNVGGGPTDDKPTVTLTTAT